MKVIFIFFVVVSSVLNADAKSVKLRVEKRLDSFSSVWPKSIADAVNANRMNPYLTKSLANIGLAPMYQSTLVPSDHAGFNILTICEIEVFSRDGTKLTLSNPKQSSNYEAGSVAALAIDGNKNTKYKAPDCPNGICCTHTAHQPLSSIVTQNPLRLVNRVAFWEADLDLSLVNNDVNQVRKIVIHNREDCCSSRIVGAMVYINGVPFEYIQSSSKVIVLEPILPKVRQTISQDAINIGDTEVYPMFKSMVDELRQGIRKHPFQDEIMATRDIVSKVGLGSDWYRNEVQCVETCPYPGDGVNKSDRKFKIELLFDRTSVELDNVLLRDNDELALDFLSRRMLQVVAAPDSATEEYVKRYDSWYCGCHSNKCGSSSDKGDMGKICGHHCAINMPGLCTFTSDYPTIGSVGERMDQYTLPERIHLKSCNIDSDLPQKSVCGRLELRVHFTGSADNRLTFKQYCQKYGGLANLGFAKIPLIGPLIAGGLTQICFAHGNSARVAETIPQSPCLCPITETVSTTEVVNGTEVTILQLPAELSAERCKSTPRLCDTCMMGDLSRIKLAEEECANELYPIQTEIEQRLTQSNNETQRQDPSIFPQFSELHPFNEPCVCPYTDFADIEAVTQRKLDIDVCVFRHEEFCKACLLADKERVEQLRDECSTSKPVYNPILRAARNANMDLVERNNNSFPMLLVIPLTITSFAILIGTVYLIVRDRSRKASRDMGSVFKTHQIVANPIYEDQSKVAITS